MQEWVFDREGAQTRRALEAPADLPPSPAPAGARRRLGRRGRWVIAAGAALAVLTGGFAVAAASPDPAPVAAAADGSGDPVPGTQAPDVVPPTQTLPDGGATEDDGATSSAPWSALHEEREMRQPDGTTVTIALQGGTVTALSGNSVTVESSDGFSRTYAVTADTRIATPSGTLAELATGDAVLVEAVVEGDTATAATLRPAPTTGGQQFPESSTSGSDQDTGDA